MPPKRKADDVQRNFQKRWTDEYFFAEFDGKAICLICNASVAAIKDYNVCHHYDTTHRAKKKSDSAVEATYLISKVCAVCPEKKESFANISLSRNTVVERLTDIAKNIKSQLREKAGVFRAFSVALDESTDVVNTAQLAIFVSGLRLPRFTHTTPLLRSLHWLPIAARIQFKTLPLTYRCLDHTAPSYLQTLVSQYIPSRPLRSSSARRLTLPPLHSPSSRARSFSSLASKWWNDLPTEVKTAKSVAYSRRIFFRQYL
ncbi:GT2D2 protein, partial [Amia calva]|nr:GT2D2 protein [Amia calva]